MMNFSAPIGIFDSGVGGLSVLRALRQQIPAQSLIYLADQAHVPYGPRPLEEVRRFSIAITRYLLSEGAKLIIVACNTASAAALHTLRWEFPETPFVGMEPAVKPASQYTRSGVVGVLATPATFQGELYASVIDRFARGVTVLESTCPGLVEQIEVGNLSGKETRRILEDALGPMIREGVDSIVLGCTHYPFVIPLIREIVGPQVNVIDPAPAVARQAGRVLQNPEQVPTEAFPSLPTTTVRYMTTSEPKKLARLLPLLLGETGPVENVVWGNEL